MNLFLMKKAYCWQQNISYKCGIDFFLSTRALAAETFRQIYSFLKEAGIEIAMKN